MERRTQYKDSFEILSRVLKRSLHKNVDAITNHLNYPENIYSKYSDSEANSSECLKNLEEIYSYYYMHSNVYNL